MAKPYVLGTHREVADENIKTETGRAPDNDFAVAAVAFGVAGFVLGMVGGV